MSIPLAGAVCSEQQRASDIGTSILADGGNAADAMVATVIAVNTLCPYHSDLGGGGFALIRTADGGHESLDFRHAAPKAISMEYFKHISTSIGGAAVAVPGQMRGLEEIHRKCGRLPWKRLFEDSIRLASDGAAMQGDLHDFVTRDLIPPGSTQRAGSWMADDPEYDVFFRDGEIIPQGQMVRRKRYARTLKLLAEGGADAFYHGEIAGAIVEATGKLKGLMTLEDLAHYKPRWNTPLSAKYHGHTLWAPPAPASGAIWLSAMGTLSHFETLGSEDVLDLHRLTEAMRLAYGQRTQLGDPSFVPEVTTHQQSWISPEGMARRAKLIDNNKTFPPDYYKPPRVEIKEDHGTSHIIAADADGLVISLTTTIGLSFGSRILVPGYGFCLNDSMDDFSVAGRPKGTGYEPSPANYVFGGKRPLSSSCPYIVENDAGEVVLAGGAAGGSTIISANLQVARNVLDYGMSAAEALRASRLHNQILPNHSEIEQSSISRGVVIDGFSEEQAQGLESKGHKLLWTTKARNTATVMKFLPGSAWEVAGEPRKLDSGGSVYYP